MRASICWGRASRVRLIAKRMVQIAESEGADAVAHGATGKGNDQVRFELTVAALAPRLQVIAPWRDDRFRSKFPGRAEMIAYCEERKIPVEASAKKPYSMDRNLLHISFESGMLEDPWFDASAPAQRDMYKLSVSPEEAPDRPEYLELLFEKGSCVELLHPELEQILSQLNYNGSARQAQSSLDYARVEFNWRTQWGGTCRHCGESVCRHEESWRL